MTFGRGRKQLLLLLLVGFLVCAGSLARAHDERDPVCGMLVPVEGAEWTAEHGGRTYYFCSEEDLRSFLANPREFVGGIRLRKSEQGVEWSLLVTARPPGPARVLLRAERGGVPVDLGGGTAVVYRVDRASAPRARRFRLHSLGDADSGFQFLATEGEEYRIGVEPPGEVLSLRSFFSVTLPTAPGAPPSREGEPAPHSHEESGRAESLAMGRQHEAMLAVGREWADIGLILLREDARTAPVAASVRRLREELALTPRFDLHRFPEDRDEFASLAAGALRELTRLETAIARDDRTAALAEYRRFDAQACTRCHLKYRFGAVKDLGRLSPASAQGSSR